MKDFVITREAYITVIDAPCGVGKTSWAIQYINNEPDKSFVYCTPRLTEIDRIREGCGKRRFWEPGNVDGRSKLEDFNRILATGQSVAVTHMTFLNADSETFQLLHEGNYTLILDEALEVVMDFNEVHRVSRNPAQAQMNATNLEYLFNHDMIVVDPDTSRVSWNDCHYGEDGAFSEVERLAKMGQLYFARGKLLIAVYPPELFQQFENVYICTYLFPGTTMKYYLDLFRLEYQTLSVYHDKERGYYTGPHTSSADCEFREVCNRLVNVCDKKNLLPLRKMSKSWFDNCRKSNKNALTELRTDMKKYFRSVKESKGAQVRDIMWTAPSDCEELLSGTGFTEIERLTEEDKDLAERERNEVIARKKCFVPCNAIATNMYRERWVLAYCMNLFMQPMIKGWFEDFGVQVDENLWTLQSFLQLVCRSRIRDREEPIELFLPSDRMRAIYKRWIGGDWML